MYIILIVILIVILILIVFLTYHSTPISFIKEGFNGYMNDGDLILFRWNSVGILHEMLSSFTHVGIVINGEILETHLKGDTESVRGGVHLYNLKDRISKYKGSNYILKAKTPLTKTQTKFILDNLEEYKKIPFHDEYEKHFKNVCIPKMICKKCFKTHEKKSMFCSEFVGFILKELGILPVDYNLECLTPQSFLNLKDKNNNKIFGDVFKLN